MIIVSSDAEKMRREKIIAIEKLTYVHPSLFSIYDGIFHGLKHVGIMSKLNLRCLSREWMTRVKWAPSPGDFCSSN